MITGRVSVEAHIGLITMLCRSQNEARIRQAVRGIKDMFKKDGLS